MNGSGFVFLSVMVAMSIVGALRIVQIDRMFHLLDMMPKAGAAVVGLAWVTTAFLVARYFSRLITRQNLE
jgi:hypothetical protein